jgi:hypothetical protein
MILCLLRAGMGTMGGMGMGGMGMPAGMGMGGMGMGGSRTMF